MMMKEDIMSKKRTRIGKQFKGGKSKRHCPSPMTDVARAWERVDASGGGDDIACDSDVTGGGASPTPRVESNNGRKSRFKINSPTPHRNLRHPWGRSES